MKNTLLKDLLNVLQMDENADINDVSISFGATLDNDHISFERDFYGNITLTEMLTKIGDKWEGLEGDLTPKQYNMVEKAIDLCIENKIEDKKDEELYKKDIYNYHGVNPQMFI